MERACRKTVFSADDLLNEIGVYHYGTGKSETAQKFFKRAMELAPECGNYVHNYCVALVTLGWYSTAFPYLCERCEQGDEELYYNLGYAYYYYHLHGMARCTNLCRTASRARPKMWPRRPSGCPRAMTSGVIRCCRRYISTITGIRTKRGISKKEAMGFLTQGRHSRFACREPKAATVIPWLVWGSFTVWGTDAGATAMNR